MTRLRRGARWYQLPGDTISTRCTKHVRPTYQVGYEDLTAVLQCHVRVRDAACGWGECDHASRPVELQWSGSGGYDATIPRAVVHRGDLACGERDGERRAVALRSYSIYGTRYHPARCYGERLHGSCAVLVGRTAFIG